MTTTNRKTLICIVGPTAVGKTAVAISIAKKLGTEILSADSRQFYREMRIGTAMPSDTELAEAKHHFIGHLSVTDAYSAGDFERDALQTLDQLFQNLDTVLLVGGSGLFIRAVCEGFDELPVVEDSIRRKFNEEFEEYGIEHLQSLVAQKDPAYFATVDQRNPQRLIRALEVIESTGKPFSELHKKAAKIRPFDIVTVGLDLPRETLYERINHRADDMVRSGLPEEVKSLTKYRSEYALQTVGYAELFAFLDGKITFDEAVEKIRQNSRRYAKRQLTWFRKNGNVTWFSPDQLSEILEFIRRKTAQA